MNRLKLNSPVLMITGKSSDNNPTHFYVRQVGVVTSIRTDSSKCLTFSSSECNKQICGDNGVERYLKPGTNGLCYYFAPLENMNQYEQVNGNIIIPVSVLKRHFNTFVSPWG